MIKTQLQTLFENIQRISDTTTLPYAMHSLRARIVEKLDLSYFKDRLMQTKGESSFLAVKEKFELWERLKVLSFTRATASMWAMTLLSLYVRVQVNILGRHLYLEMARGSDGSQGESDTISKIGQQEYLATADYLSTYGINTLIMNMRSAVSDVMKEKELKDRLTGEQLQETIMEIVDRFMGMGATGGQPGYWINYLLPENATQYRELMAMSSSGFNDSSLLMDLTKLDQLMSETRSVLSSPDFRAVVDTSLRKLAEMLTEEINSQIIGSDGGPNSLSGTPLAKLLPRVAQLSVPLLEEPSGNKFIQEIRNLNEVQLFYTFLYANIPRD